MQEYKAALSMLPNYLTYTHDLESFPAGEGCIGGIRFGLLEKFLPRLTQLESTAMESMLDHVGMVAGITHPLFCK